MKDINYINTALCNISEYHNKLSYDFGFEYFTTSYHKNQDILMHAYLYFSDIISSYDSKNNYEKSAKDIIFNFVKDLYTNTGDHIRMDLSIKNKDLDFINFNVFTKEGYLVNTYKFKILDMKRTKITDEELLKNEY